MDEIKLQYLINMSKRYLDNKLESNEKNSVEAAAKSLFYQTLYEDSPDSELNKQIRLFAAMAQHFSKDKPMSHQKAEDLQEMVAYMQSTIMWPVHPRSWRVSLLSLP
ncbi:MAG: hypothetical protein JRI91_13280 [Deltaproteobacteria bacterium]|nr:hypothetical protein [Deltaproteobacteria bacterium]